MLLHDINAFKSLVENAFDAVIITEPTLESPGPRITYVNQALCDLTGYSRAELIGQTPRLFQGPLTDKQALACLRHELEGGGVFEGSTINYRKDGLPYLVHWKTWPVADDDGRVRCYVAVQHDEPRHSEAHSFTSALVDAMDNGILGTDEIGQITFANHEARKLAGASSLSKLFGKPISNLFRKNPAAPSLGPGVIQKAVTERARARFKGIHLANRGNGVRVVDLSINPIPDLKDGSIGSVAVITDASERLFHEQQLQRDNERLENILAGTDAGTWEWDLETNRLTVNDRWLALIGHHASAPHELTIDDWRALVHPDDLDEANTRLAAHIAGETPYYEVEFRMHHDEGRWVWILSRGKIIDRDETGKPRRFAGTHLDISARKLAETERLEEKAKFEALFEGLNDAVFVHPVEPFGYANFIEVNQVACDRYGYSKDQMLSRSPADLRDPDAIKTLGSPELLQALYRDGHILYETRHRRSDGSSFPVEISTKLFDFNGTKALMSLVRDISARKRNEAKILQSTAMFDRSSEGIAVTDREGKILSVNPAFERLTGYSREEVVGKNPRILHSGRHDDAFYRKMWHDLDCHGTWQGEIWNRRKNGELILEWQTITAIEDEDGVVTNYISIFSDITSAKKSQEEVHYLSWHDHLTGLPNRRRLEKVIGEELERPGHLAVFYIDLDRFKDVNDSFGHEQGDFLLQKIAERLGTVLPEDGTLARFSGDEFVMIARFNRNDLAQIDHHAEVILRQFEEPTRVGEVDIVLTATIGIAVSPDDGGDGPTLLRHAHSALNESKRNGRNTHTVYSPGTPNYSREKILMESSLRLALEREEFVVCFQPQVDMRTGVIIGSEALVRWRPPNEAEISPGNFIPVAEDSGLIVPLGEWVLRQACESSVAWATNGTPRRVAVNLSGRQLIDKSIVDTVRGVIDDTGIPPECLELEITETFLVENTSALETMRRLKALGVRLSIDDFGTGHSSLARLKELPVDKLKIDQAFVRGVTRNKGDAAITRAIIAMGNSLELDVLAEGVETREQCRFLVHEGCFHGQGFLFSHAQDAHDALSIDRLDHCHDG